MYKHLKRSVPSEYDIGSHSAGYWLCSKWMGSDGLKRFAHGSWWLAVDVDGIGGGDGWNVFCGTVIKALLANICGGRNDAESEGFGGWYASLVPRV
jgi:hypothetical protein